MRLGIVLAIIYTKTVHEVVELNLDRLLNGYVLLVLHGHVIGLVHPDAHDIWYRPAANAEGYRIVEGRWQLTLTGVAELDD